MKTGQKLALMALSGLAALCASGDNTPVWSEPVMADTRSVGVGGTVEIKDDTDIAYSAVWIGTGVKSRIKAASSSSDYQVMAERPGEGLTRWIYDSDMVGGGYNMTLEILDSNGAVVKTLTARASLQELGLTEDSEPVMADTKSLGTVIHINNMTDLTYGSVWAGAGASCGISATLEGEADIYTVLASRSGEGLANWLYPLDQDSGTPDSPYTLSHVIKDSGGTTLKTLTAQVVLDEPEYTQDSAAVMADTRTPGTLITLFHDDLIAYSTEWKKGDSASVIAVCSEAGVEDYEIYTTGYAPKEGVTIWNYVRESETRLPRNATYTLSHVTLEDGGIKDQSLSATVKILPEPAIAALLGLAAILTGLRQRH